MSPIKRGKDVYPYVEMTLLLSPEFPAHTVVRNKYVTATQYNQIKDYVMSQSSEGKRKLGKTNSGGFALIGFCKASSSSVLNHLYETMMEQAVDLIDTGLSDDYGIALGTGHPELEKSLAMMNVFWSKDIDKVKELYYVDQNAVHVLEDCMDSPVIKSIISTNDENQYSE